MVTIPLTTRVGILSCGNAAKTNELSACITHDNTIISLVCFHVWTACITPNGMPCLAAYYYMRMHDILLLSCLDRKSDTAGIATSKTTKNNDR